MRSEDPFDSRRKRTTHLVELREAFVAACDAAVTALQMGDYDAMKIAIHEQGAILVTIRALPLPRPTPLAVRAAEEWRIE